MSFLLGQQKFLAAFAVQEAMRQCMDAGRLICAVENLNANTEIFLRSFCIFDNDIEIAIVIEDARVA